MPPSACVPRSCGDQRLAQSYRGRCATLSGPLCAVNLQLRYIIAGQRSLCTCPSLPYGDDPKHRPTVRISRAMGNLFWRLPVSPAPSTLPQRFVLLLDAKLMIPNPRCVLLTLWRTACQIEPSIFLLGGCCVELPWTGSHIPTNSVWQVRLEAAPCSLGTGFKVQTHWDGMIAGSILLPKQLSSCLDIQRQPVV